MAGRHEVVVTRELTVGAHLGLAMEMASAPAAAPRLLAG
jgi:hypothetical protein